MSKCPKKSLPDISTPEGLARMNNVNQYPGYFYYPSAWRYENEPRVLFKVHVLRSPLDGLKYGGKTIIGIPESLVGKPKLEKKWIMYELGGQMVKLKAWRPFVLPELKHKRLLT